ncbi:MAG: helicase-related protein [Sphingorhabdus sp.]
MSKYKRSPVIAILGPTNTGKTHLAVERMCAHSSGMMGFPLRLLAREVYERIVKIKGDRQVALITGEERIEPPGAQYFCCTVESMPIERDFAFVAIDEAQLGADPERGHIFTDRVLHARGREETMVLGAESLRPIIQQLLPEAEITTRPRFSTLSYAGAKKLSRLPKRSAIVAFSVEQVYAAAELLRRLRGGAAVVMGALSPRTRNAQVEMFQSGEVDYLVATDAIGMGLNLDVRHVAFAGLSKFDGKRRRRLTVSEMAQIAGRAGRHQTDGTFGTLAGGTQAGGTLPGEGFEMTPEEVSAIENHSFPRLDWLYWREAKPRVDSLAMLIGDLGTRPEETGLCAAPEALDLDVLNRLADMPDVTQLLRGPPQVLRLWEAARLPDFRQLGAEPHSRFIASLWRHLGQGNGHIPQRVAAQELARLDNIQGDVDTISGRIAAVRSWAYIAQRADWLAEPVAMAERARALEEKLSDALHAGLRQRFVDKRTVKLMRGSAEDAALLPVEISVDNRVFVDDEYIGSLRGFAFMVDAAARAGDRKMLLAAAQRHLAGYLREKARKVAMSQDGEFSLAKNDAGHPVIDWKGERLGSLTKGRGLLQPLFQPERGVGDLEGDALRDVVQRAETWITASLEKHMGGIVALDKLAQDAATEAPVRALAMQLAEAGGIAGRQYLSDAIRALPKEARGAARKGGIVFGALDIFHHQAMKPAAVKWRMALFAARDEKPVAELPPESAVHLAEWTFASAADCRNAGYRRVGDEYLRIDLAERVIKKAHEARSEKNIFGMDLSFATSLGVSEKGLAALMRDAGFRGAERPAESVEADADNGEVKKTEQAAADIVDPAAGSKDGDVKADSSIDAGTDAAAEQPPVLTYWRWVGLGKAGGNRRRGGQASKPGGKKPGRGGPSKEPGNKPEKKKAPAAPSALALQLAALTGKEPPR